MKRIKLFENFTQSEEEISKICDELGIKNWTLNSEGLVDVDGDVNLNRKKLTKIPIRFGKVTGRFNCSDNNLNSLEGAPKSVGG